MMIECGSKCVCGDECQNQRIRRRQYPKLKPLLTKDRGWGLMTLEELERKCCLLLYPPCKVALVVPLVNACCFSQRIPWSSSIVEK